MINDNSNAELGGHNFHSIAIIVFLTSNAIFNDVAIFNTQICTHMFFALKSDELLIH